MAKTHDESKDLRSFSRIGKVSYGDKTLQAPKSAIIGNGMWGKIDYLTHYCGWRFYWNNSAVKSFVTNDSNDRNTSAREVKKAKKEYKLTDKTKRTSNKK